MQSSIVMLLNSNTYKNKVKFQVAYIALRKDGIIGAASIQKGFYYVLGFNHKTKLVQVKGILE